MRNIIGLSPCVQWGYPTLFVSFQTNLYTSAMLSNARWYHEKCTNFNIGGSKSTLNAFSYHFASFKTHPNFSQVSWHSFLGLLQSLISLFQLCCQHIAVLDIITWKSTKFWEVERKQIRPLVPLFNPHARVVCEGLVELLVTLNKAPHENCFSSPMEAHVMGGSCSHSITTSPSANSFSQSHQPTMLFAKIW